MKRLIMLVGLLMVVFLLVPVSCAKAPVPPSEVMSVPPSEGMPAPMPEALIAPEREEAFIDTG